MAGLALLKLDHVLLGQHEQMSGVLFFFLLCRRRRLVGLVPRKPLTIHATQPEHGDSGKSKPARQAREATACACTCMLINRRTLENATRSLPCELRLGFEGLHRVLLQPDVEPDAAVRLLIHTCEARCAHCSPSSSRDSSRRMGLHGRTGAGTSRQCASSGTVSKWREDKNCTPPK